MAGPKVKRPPRPSADHQWDRERKQWMTPAQIERERDAMLQEDGRFTDIEDHIPWRLKGSTAHVSLLALKGDLGNEYDAHEVEEMMHAGAEVMGFQDSRKAMYWRLVEQYVAQGFKDNLDHEMLETWRLYCEGLGERKIAEYLTIARTKVRKHLSILKKSVLANMPPA